MKQLFLDNEDHIVKCLSKGDIHAFNTLFNAYSGRLYNFAKIYLKSSSESEELVQEVFTIVWDKRKGLISGLSFKSYLFTIAFNVIKKHFRTRHYKNEFLKSLNNTDLDLQTTDKVSYESLCDFLRELVDRMPNRRREIFIKSRFEGLSIKEISKDLEISHKTVENHLTIALKFIRANLKRELL